MRNAQVKSLSSAFLAAKSIAVLTFLPAKSAIVIRNKARYSFRIVSRSLSSAAITAKPIAVLNFVLPAGAFDVNVTPDKRRVLLQRESEVVEGLGRALGKLWEPSR